MSDSTVEQINKLLTELQTEEHRAIATSNAHSTSGATNAATSVAHYVDGIRHASRKLQAILRTTEQ